MKLLLHYPSWGNRWIPYIKKELSCYDLTVTSTNDQKELFKLSKKADVLLSMWANELLHFWTTVFPEKRIISYLRRYELFRPKVFDKINWDKVDDLIFVNTALKQLFEKKVPDTTTRTHLIYNGIDLNEFKLSTFAKTGKKIAMICQIHTPKNINLACQILLELPKEYKIYHIGGVSHINLPEFEFYLAGLGLKDRFIMDGIKKPSQANSWLVNKDFILSTSVSEGNPVNVIEGMAMGLKPVIHRWPGAEDQFEDDYLFYTAKEAVDIIIPDKPDMGAEYYRSLMEEKFHATNYEQLRDIVHRESH